MVYMLFVTLIALNALIALLGDSFEKVQEHAVAKKNRGKATLTVDYMDMMSDKRRLDLEYSTLWAHQLVPASRTRRRFSATVRRPTRRPACSRTRASPRPMRPSRRRSSSTS